MKFNNVFKKTISSLKEATLSFWIMCVITLLLSMCHGAINTYLDGDSNIMGITYDEDVELAEDDNDFEKYLNDYEEITIEDTDISDAEDLKELILLLVEMVAAILITPIVYYYMMACSIESVEKQPIVKGKNLCKVILAQLLFSLIALIPASCCMALIVLGVFSGQFILSVLGTLITLVVFLYVTIRYSTIAYVAIKYQSYNVKEIVRQSAQLIKGNVLKVMLYRVGLGFGALVIAILYLIIGLVLKNKCPQGIYISFSFIGLSVIHVLYMAFGSMFNVNMFKELEA